MMCSFVLLLAVATLSMADAAAFLPSSRVPHSLCETNTIYQSVPNSSDQRKIAMRASVDVPLCVEAVVADSPDGNPITNGWSTRTNRLERGEKRWGYDVTSARGWMEHLEQECGAGAYTVLRCDGNECGWRVWGLEFHLDRLCSSYGALRGITDWKQCSFEEEAKAQTNNIITTLLQEAELAMRDSAKASTDENTAQDGKGEEFARTLMVTILWTLPATDNERSAAKPTIRGHAAFIGGASPATNGTEDAMPAPIAACLGIPSDPTPEALALLPRRYSGETCEKPGPSAKISSWCRERRPLEDPSRFKPPGSGVGEVLLVRQCKAPTHNENDDGDFLDSLDFLEGLTSNLFVIYKDGTVRTAPTEKVLSGYARQLVMDELSGHRTLALDYVNAPTIEDARNGLWSEVFITSSIRLIVPVNRVVIPPVGRLDTGTLWQSESHFFPLTHSLWTAVRGRGYQSAERR